MSLAELLGQLRAEGSYDSSGAFTLHLDRMLPLLARYQLPSPDRCLLRFLAAAVNAGAGYFTYTSLWGGYRVGFNGRPLTGLDRLFENLLQDGDRSLAELAVGVNAARASGARVMVSGAESRLDLEGATLTLTPESCVETRVEVIWKGTRAWLRAARLSSGAERTLLGFRGELSGLTLLLRQPWNLARPSAGEVVRVGNPPLRFPAARQRESSGGSGYLFLNSSYAQVRYVVDGVSFAQTGCPGVTVWWWDDRLQLDLTREQLVENPQVVGELEAVLAAELAARLDSASPWRSWLVQYSLRNPDSPSAGLPLVPLADGGSCNARDLLQWLAEDGYLAYCHRTFRAPGDSRVLLDVPLVRELGELLSPMLDLSWRRGLRQPQLPGGQEYLLRLPLEGPGEVGLRANSYGAGSRSWTIHGWRQERSPLSIDRASTKPLKNDWKVSDVAFALLNRKAVLDHELATLYLLEFLYAASAGRTLDSMLGNPRWVWKGDTRNYTGADLTRLVSHVRLRQANGQVISLPQLLAGPSHRYTVARLTSPPPPPDALLLHPNAQSVLGGVCRGKVAFSPFTAGAERRPASD